MANSRLVLVDAYSQIFRAFYAIRELTNSRGEPINALHGFIKIMLKLEREYPSNSGAVVFDCGRVNFRMDLNPEYKANRKPTPDELKQQVPFIREFLELRGWPILEECEYEADDLIAALAVNSDHEVYFLSTDKDLSQIVNPRITQLVPDIKSSFCERNIEKVNEKFGVPPELVVDYLALLGDSADNIPGVPGVGNKTAAKWLQSYGTLLPLLENETLITDVKVRAKISENKELIRKNINLIKLRTDLPERYKNISVCCCKKAPDYDKLDEFCCRYGLNSIRKELASEAPIPTKEEKAEMVQDDLFGF